MAAGVMTQAWRVSNAADWTGAIYLWVGSRGAPRDLLEAAASLVLQPPRGSRGRQPFTLSTDNGRLAISDNAVAIDVARADMAGLSDGDWPFDLYVTYPDATTEWTLTGIIRVLSFGGADAQPGPSSVDVIQSTGVVEVVSGAQGPPGERGEPGATDAIVLAAAQALVARRAIKAVAGAGADYASCATPGDAYLLAGVSDTSAPSGGLISVQLVGEMHDPAWSWTVGRPIYCGVSGQLTQAEPTSGWVRQIAVAVATDRILIHAQPLAGVEQLAAYPSQTTFNLDGTITETVAGQACVTTFEPDGSIQRAYGPPLNKTITTRFAGGGISETES